LTKDKRYILIFYILVMKLIGFGAEAKIYEKRNSVLKERLEKKYRHPKIDIRLRKLRTRSEGKLLKKVLTLGINVPKVLSSNDKKMTLELEKIEGIKVRDILDGSDEDLKKVICKEIGKSIKKLHQNDIVHGDLTTSNMIWNDKLFLIDFGLGKVSSRLEDKAVDIHLLKECLKSKHHVHWMTYWKVFKNNYGLKKTFDQLEKVEARARYNRIS